jgi:hypothetical protein
MKTLEFDTTVTLGNVLVLIGLLGNIVAFAGGFNRTMALTEAAVQENRRRIETIERVQAQLLENQTLLRENIISLTEVLKQVRSDIQDLKVWRFYGGAQDSRGNR